MHLMKKVLFYIKIRTFLLRIYVDDCTVFNYLVLNLLYKDLEGNFLNIIMKISNAVFSLMPDFFSVEQLFPTFINT